LAYLYSYMCMGAYWKIYKKSGGVLLMAVKLIWENE
jgi:hypothetical protein